MLEAMIEKDAKEFAEGLGGVCMKWVSPGNVGVPDRILSFAHSGPFFMEFKAPGKRLRANQKAMCVKLARKGFRVYINVDSIKKAREIIEDEASGFDIYRHEPLPSC